MANMSISIDLLKLTGAVKATSKKGTPYLAIPLEGNNIFEGEKGCYLKLTAIEMKEQRDKKTHLVKQEGKKEDNRPIIGDAIYWGKTGVTEQAAPEVKASSGDDDLPF